MSCCSCSCVRRPLLPQPPAGRRITTQLSLVPLVSYPTIETPIISVLGAYVHALGAYYCHSRLQAFQVLVFMCAEPCNPFCSRLHSVTRLTYVHRAGDLRQDQVRCIACTAAAHLQPAVHLVVPLAGQSSSRVSSGTANQNVSTDCYWVTLPS